jgi:hypothetical protein
MKKTLDDEKRAAIYGILAVGGTRRLAARYVGCSPATIHNTVLRDAEFRRRIRKAEVRAEYDFLSTIRAAAAKKDARYWQAAKWALQHMYPERYSRRARTMALEDVKDLISHLLAAILKVIPESSLRAAVRLQVRTVAGAAIRKAKEPRRAKSN